MKKIPVKLIGVRASTFAIVDDEDYESISKIKWHLDSCGYAIYTKYKGRKDYSKKCEIIRMHRLLLPVDMPFMIDHKDRNKLNNQKSNLRIATASQNSINKRIKKNATGERGVYNNKGNGFRACACIRGERIFLGLFPTIQLAKEAYVKRMKEEHGEFYPE